jgi:hypothetical protein
MRVNAVLLALSLASCATNQSVGDYEKFYDRAPYTVVVLPPTNQSPDAEAPRFFLSTITQPLVNRGYYVIPVEAVAEMMAVEGLAEGGALRQVKPQKFREHFGADAVLYVDILTWDTSYLVLASSVTVAMNYRLVHTDSGEVLWSESAQHTVTSDSAGGGGLGSLVGALINAAVTAASTDYVPLAREANIYGLRTLPAGPYNDQFEEEKKRNLEAQKRANDSK